MHSFVHAVSVTSGKLLGAGVGTPLTARSMFTHNFVSCLQSLKCQGPDFHPPYSWSHLPKVSSYVQESQSKRMDMWTSSLETVIRGCQCNPWPKTPCSRSSAQHKDRGAQGSISPESYFGFHIKVTGGLG